MIKQMRTDAMDDLLLFQLCPNSRCDVWQWQWQLQL